MKLALLNVEPPGAPVRPDATVEQFRIADVFKRIGNGSGTSINTGGTVWTPAGGKKYRVLEGMITSTVAGEVVFTDSAGAFVYNVFVLANTPQFFRVGNNGFLSPTAGNTLVATLATATLWGNVCGCEE